MTSKIVTFLALAFIFISCESNNDDLDTIPGIKIEANELLGTWKLTSNTIKNGSIKYTVSGISVSGNYEAVGKDFDYNLTFSENPNLVESSGDYTIAVTVSVLNQSNTSEHSTQSIDGLTASNWSVEDEYIVFTSNNIESKFKVIEKSANFLKLSSVIEKSIDYDGYEAEVKGTIFVTLEK